MDEKDVSIVTQVAFKEASSQALALGLNLTMSEHQAAWEELFSFLTHSLFGAIRAQNGGAAAMIQQHFPGAQPVQQPAQQPQSVMAGSFQPMQDPYTPNQQGYPGQGSFQPMPSPVVIPRVKGQSNGAFPDWALAAFAEQGVQEVYDNRHMLATNPKRPWFKSTSGGDNAPAFWPPDR